MNIGKIPERVLKRSVFKQLPIRNGEITGGAGVGADCAVFAHEEGMQTALCVNTVTGDPDSIGIYAVHAAVNNIAAGGARPTAVLIAATFPADTGEEWLRRVMKQIGDTAKELDVTVAGGHTEISGFVRAPIISVTGIGKYVTARREDALSGKDIVMTKWAGLAGTALIAREKRTELLQRYPAYFIDDAIALERRLSVVPEAATVGKSGVLAMHDASRGGIFAALWELAEHAGVGLHVDLKAIPIRQETVEICNFFDVNPYELVAGGSLLMIADNGYDLVRTLAEAQIPAAVIGKTDTSNDRVVTNGEEQRFLEPPKSDGVYRVFAQERTRKEEDA
ncbi:MAG: AIR synthase related protein [bacterium]|nr:AIR synthase related protein [bacterium]